MSFHEIRFPIDIARGAVGGPERRTDVVVLGSGAEERNARWANSRRSYNAGYGIKSLDDLHAVIAFFEERRGRLYGFRYRDAADWKSCSPGKTPTAIDQSIGTGDGAVTVFQLVKTYGSAHAPWTRSIAKPVVGTVMVAVAGVIQVPGAAFLSDPTNGRITFQSGHVPPPGSVVSAGYEFDVPVRFDTDKLEIDIKGFAHGAIPSIPIVEVRT
jgi:uncharacterized protein (TIGR02217 family)